MQSDQRGAHQIAYQILVAPSEASLHKGTGLLWDSGKIVSGQSIHGEEGINMIRALLGLGDLVTNVNLENAGQISNAPLHAVVETNAHFSRAGVRPLSAGALPAELAPLTINTLPTRN